MLDSVIESDEKYYPQRFLEECKYVQENYIYEELGIDSDDNDDDDDDDDDDDE